MKPLLRVQRADSCIWIVDDRDPDHHQEVHLTPDQARRMAQALTEAADTPGQHETQVVSAEPVSI